MRIRKIALVSMLIIVSTVVTACHRKTPPPPRDAKVISETQMEMDTTETIKSKPAGGGGSRLNEKQW